MVLSFNAQFFSHRVNCISVKQVLTKHQFTEINNAFMNLPLPDIAYKWNNIIVYNLLLLLLGIMLWRFILFYG